MMLLFLYEPPPGATDIQPSIAFVFNTYHGSLVCQTGFALGMVKLSCVDNVPDHDTIPEKAQKHCLQLSERGESDEVSVSHREKDGMPQEKTLVCDRLFGAD